jgi:hypothetical protein
VAVLDKAKHSSAAFSSRSSLLDGSIMIAPPGRTRVDRALVQCLVSVHGGPSALRIVSGGIRSLPATSSGVGSPPIACRRCRQVRTILFKASMVSTDKLRCIFYPPPIAHIWRDPPRFRKLRAPPAVPGAPSCCRYAALPRRPTSHG